MAPRWPAASLPHPAPEHDRPTGHMEWQDQRGFLRLAGHPRPLVCCRAEWTRTLRLPRHYRIGPLAADTEVDPWRPKAGGWGRLLEPQIAQPLQKGRVRNAQS